ncbi:winged helix-turn-helix transcriptional regulator [Paenibacillus sp. J5C_2022]|uniref:helix-turn-helix transcriptional regulator n=1 Tax=Paenibacillus sp. J5C2022 TaxID=2977129 RepID=UPI0021CDEFAB|nr:winged helix-turn-helix transcriptional regulator [Paenibacillus sp. J5C2022]MCU6707565.1 winged helix-turn-helix transcriptional regulator [Paenibacillus sp. J5C2022]
MRGEEPTTRRRILNALKRHGKMSASALANEIGLTEMGIRRHMYGLEKEGYVEIESVRQAMGRPLHAYALTASGDELFPKNYHLLTLDLLSELEDEQFIDAMFEGRGKKLLNRYAPRMEGKALAKRVEELAAIQNAGGYMVELERHSDRSYTMHEYNCPIAQVAGVYQQACSCELELFRSLLQVPVERTECLAKGGGKCSYVIDGQPHTQVKKKLTDA